jgi:hypothetical protein
MERCWDMSIVEGQKVEVSWNGKTKKWFIDRGYIFTFSGDNFLVKVEDLNKGSKIKVKVQCDYCFNILLKAYTGYLKELKCNSNHVGKVACTKCKYIKRDENYLVAKRIRRKNKSTHCCHKCHTEYPLNSNYFNRDKTTTYGYDLTCKNCKKKEYHENKNLLSDQYYSYSEALKLYDEAINLKLSLPYGFWKRIDKSTSKKLLDFIFFDLTDSGSNNFNNVDTNFISQFKLNDFTAGKSIYEFLSEFYSNVPFPWQMNTSPQGYWKSDENKKKALEWFIKEIAKDNVISNLDDIPKVCTYKLFKEYGLGGLVAKSFNSSPFEAINFIYPGRYNFWDFFISRSDYYTDERIKEILKWLINELLKDKVIANIDEIPSNVNIYTFEKYNLKSFLYHRFNGVSYKAFEFLYPGKWMPWEFKSCPEGYWENRNNIVNAIDWLIVKLIEDGYAEGIDEIPNLPLSMLMEDYNLTTVLSNKYKFFDILMEEYPSYFNLESLNINIAKDGTKVLSRGELLIHNYLIDNFKNVKYFSTSGRDTDFINLNYQEKYVPDWIINDNIIIEFFGYYNKNSTSERFVKYREKMKRKIKYFSSLSGFNFISVYQKDIGNNFSGLKKKLSSII